MPRNPDKTDYSTGFPAGFDAFATLTDPRDTGNTRHHFGEILFIAFAAVLCGVRSYELMEEFGEQSHDWLRKWLTLPNGIPCANTFSRLFQAIEPTAFAACIAAHLERLGFAMKGGQIAIDGKIVQKDGDYILSAKGNQGTLHDEIQDHFNFAVRQLDPALLDPQRWTHARTQDTGHDRHELREILVCHDLSWMDPVVRNSWENLNCVIMVRRHTLVGSRQNARPDQLLHEQPQR